MNCNAKGAGRSFRTFLGFRDGAACLLESIKMAKQAGKVKRLDKQLTAANITCFIVSDAGNYSSSHTFGFTQAFESIDPCCAIYFQENAEPVLISSYNVKEQLVVTSVKRIPSSVSTSEVRNLETALTTLYLSTAVMSPIPLSMEALGHTVVFQETERLDASRQTWGVRVG